MKCPYDSYHRSQITNDLPINCAFVKSVLFIKKKRKEDNPSEQVQTLIQV